jgi:hypothetical protein|tara:strand:+ start:1470 stop:2564 length:1095 start_codon:yes stop_codon:yes gene_type:complete
METKRMRLSLEEADLISEHRGSDVTNINENTALDLHLASRGIDKDDIVSVKHWQSASGDFRFSIVTKEDSSVNNKVLEETFDEILEDIKAWSPTFTPIKRNPLADPHCLVIDPADIHVGKLASLDETGQSYDIQKAVSQVDGAVDGILSKASGFSIDKIFFVIGNDVLHTDNIYGKTTKGTPQNTSGMWHEAFIAAKHMYVRAIEKMLPLADVHVIFNPSNHDYMSGWMLAQTLEAYYRLSKNVTFDVSIAHRKYTQYGVNLIGTNHGDGAKLDNLPLIMANEAPELWVKCPMRYIFCHHIHHKQTHKFLSGKDFVGVTVEYLRTPSASDSWHHINGYIGSKKAVEAFVHSKKHGQVARITHNL